MKCLWFAALLCGALLVSGCGAKKVRTARVHYPPSRSSPVPPRAAAPSPGHVPEIGDIESGVASWYGEPYHGRRAANGEIYDMEQLTAAHRTLPFNTWVRVHNLTNGRTVDVRITDRGPFIGDRIIDLSRAAARSIELIGPGLAQVQVTVIRPPDAPLLVRDWFGVQVGAFRESENAQRLRERLAQTYGQARIVQRADSPGQWRVVVGGCQSMNLAEQLAAHLRREFAQAYVVRTEGEPGLPAACAAPPGGPSEDSEGDH